jgi:hypothetical protein
MKKLFALMLLAACAEIEVKKDYKVVDARDTSYPKWVKDERRARNKEFKYFVSSGEDVNKELCQKSAETRASSVAAAGISQEVVDSFKQNSSSTDGQAIVAKSEELAQNIKMGLSGLEVEDRFWEKRRYLADLGATKDKVEFHCWTLLKMDGKSYDAAVKTAATRMNELLGKQDAEADKLAVKAVEEAAKE